MMPLHSGCNVTALVRRGMPCEHRGKAVLIAGRTRKDVTAQGQPLRQLTEWVVDRYGGGVSPARRDANVTLTPTRSSVPRTAALGPARELQPMKCGWFDKPAGRKHYERLSEQAWTPSIVTQTAPAGPKRQDTSFTWLRAGRPTGRPTTDTTRPPPHLTHHPAGPEAPVFSRTHAAPGGPGVTASPRHPTAPPSCRLALRAGLAYLSATSRRRVGGEVTQRIANP